MLDMLEITDFKKINLDEKEYQNQLRYFNQYYNDSFKHNQGTESVLEIIRKYCPSGKWLDVGCGSTTLFWSLMTKNISEIFCADLNVEALKILHDFVYSNDIPQCYIDVMNIYNLDKSTLNANREKIKKYYSFNSLRNWPVQLLQHEFDFITQFGVFGLSKTSEEYIQCFCNVRQALKVNGVCIGANWVLSKPYSNERGHDNSYISSDIIEEACKRYSLSLLHCGESKIENDKDYDKIIFWAVQYK